MVPKPGPHAVGHMRTQKYDNDFALTHRHPVVRDHH